MNKKYGIVALIALLIVAAIVVVWLVTQSDDEDDNGGDEIKLSQTFTDEGTGITIQYPDGWAAKAEPSGMGVLAANSQEALDADTLGEGQMGVIVMTFPLETMGVTDLAGAFEQFTTMMTGGDEDVNSSDVTDIKIGDTDAKRMTLSNGEDGDGLMIGWIADENLVVAMGSTPTGKLADVEPIVLKMAESVKVSAG